MMHRREWLGLAVLAAAIVCCGCNSTPTQDDNPSAAGPDFGAANGDDQASEVGVAAVAPSPTIIKMELESLPAAVNLDSTPGADGVYVRLRMYEVVGGQPRAATLRRGHVEFILFEGRVKDSEIAAAEATHIWRRSARVMAQYGQRVLVGTQYELQLSWQDSPPFTRDITLTARLLRPNQPPLYARPVHIIVSGV